MLLGYDPEKHPELSLPLNQPHVTLAYAKHLWVTDKKNKAYQKLASFLADYPQNERIDDLNSDDRKRLLARLLFTRPEA